VNNLLLGIGGILFRYCYPLYVPLYGLYKALSDRRERALLRDIVGPGMIAVDVGANIGIYTRFLAQLVGRDGAVFAFEPSRLNFGRLRGNIRASNVTMLEAAVGERSGTATLFLSEHANIDHRMYDSGDNRRGVDVELVSLDEYFPSGSRVDFIKIDVQGHEYSVIRGARRVLGDNPQVVCLLEFWPFGLSKAGVAPDDLMRLIAELGFAYRVVGGSADVVARPNDKVELENEYCNLIIARAA
jgi:FkbM family methyltransferase